MFDHFDRGHDRELNFYLIANLLKICEYYEANELDAFKIQKAKGR